MDENKVDEMIVKGTSGTVYGWAMRTKTNLNPVYISPGHKISIVECAMVIKPLLKVREPEPTRQADRISREYIRNNHAQLLVL